MGLFFILNLVLSGSLALLWGFINNLQLVIHAPLMNLQVPPNVLLFCKMILGLVNLTYLFPYEEKVQEWFNISSNEGKASLGLNFEYLGYNTQSAITNLIVILPLMILTICLTLLGFFLSKFDFCKTGRFYKKFQDEFNLSSVLRGVIESYFEFTLSSLLIIAQYDPTDSSNTKFLVLAIILLAGSIITPVWSIVILNKKYTQLAEEQALLKKYGALYKDLRINQKVTVFYYVFFFMRRIAVVAAIAFLRFSQSLQLIIFMLLSLFNMAYIMDKKPFWERNTQALETMNEIFILVMSCILITFSDYVDLDNEERMMFGWIFILLFILVTSINLAFLIY